MDDHKLGKLTPAEIVKVVIGDKRGCMKEWRWRVGRRVDPEELVPAVA